MAKEYILSIDQGTTSSRAILFNKEGEIKGVVQKEFKQHFPKDGWVEHDPEEIWNTQKEVIEEVVSKYAEGGKIIAAIGITNQRETTVVWDKETGEPVYNAIVWQDRRTSDYCDELRSDGWSDKIQQKTGLVLDSYFSGTKLKWILDNVDGARQKAEEGKLAFGTIDCWLIWNLTKGKKHVTDITNASRTLLFNIHDKEWDTELLELMEIPENMLPNVCSSSGEIATAELDCFENGIPITGIAGDQQAAMFGQMCLEPGMLKNTYGTGSFIMFNTGEKAITSENNLLTTIGWQMNGETTYALEGSIFIAGALVQWLRDGLGIIKSSADVEKLALTEKDNGGVYLVPAFAGLGAPHWDQKARGAMYGLTRGATAGHIARAALEGIAFQVKDVLTAMEADSGISIKELRVDGGASVNKTLMQFQSDILGIPIVRPKVTETTALGAAYLAGLAVGFWKSTDELQKKWEIDARFEPEMKMSEKERLLEKWNQAVEKSKNWV
ncbi:MAG: glycerol kinase GlpK [Balneola sp.]|nr:glycerol kinase GlpK [Balneola sp.]MBO6649837.1 glycerol kinase GlpK [Balneola sp.]MBO6712400.1 glycerol kinase GlpK [Balneola sp.]MBO6801449.1 glycerol kinase GlpK [Balneola sp.]MBO6871737.1 glycerol kinase GlpK [Balneola sp.]